MPANSETSSEAQINVQAAVSLHVLGSFIFMLLVQDNVQQMFEEYGVSRAEMVADFREALFQDDVDRLLRILMLILEIGDEEYAHAPNVEMYDDYESDEEEEIDIISYGEMRRIFQTLGPMLSSRLIFLMDTDEDNEGPPPMDSEDIDNLEKGMVTQDMVDNISKCPICLDIFKKDEEVNFLRCEHYYHCEWIKHWLKIQATCPSCRGNP